MCQKPNDSAENSDSGIFGFRDRLAAQGKILFPGLLATITVAIAARFLSEHYGGPTMLFALLLGIGFHFLSEEGPCIPGIEFASQAILKFGVALLGLGITIDQISQAGWITVGIVVGAVLITIMSGPVIARIVGRGWRLGCLTGGAVAICGASAALAIASVLPKNEHSERNTLFTVISVTTLSTVAMLLYPMIVDALNMDDLSAGIFIGATIHDVAQVVGAGYSISQEAGDTATFVKLLRVTMLIPIVLLLSLLFRKQADAGAGRHLPIPFFVIGFILLVGLGSAEWFPTGLKSILLDLSRWCLVIAIAAIGMKTALRSLKGIGGQAITLICVETVLLAGMVISILMIAKP